MCHDAQMDCQKINMNHNPLNLGDITKQPLSRCRTGLLGALLPDWRLQSGIRTKQRAPLLCFVDGIAIRQPNERGLMKMTIKIKVWLTIFWLSALAAGVAPAATWNVSDYSVSLLRIDGQRIG